MARRFSPPRRGWPSSPASPCSSPCSASTCWATACAICWTHASGSEVTSSEGRIQRKWLRLRPAVAQHLEQPFSHASKGRELGALSGNREKAFEPGQEPRADGRDPPRAILPERAVEVPAQRAQQPERADPDQSGFEDAVLPCLRASFDELGPIRGLHPRDHGVREATRAPAGREHHPSIGGVDQCMAKTTKLEVDEVDLLTREEDVVGAGIAMNIGEEWSRSFDGVAHRLELSQQGRLDPNSQVFETGLEPCDPLVERGAGPGSESSVGVEVLTEPGEAFRLTAGGGVQLAETGGQCEQRRGRAGVILLQERFDQAAVRPQVFEDEEAQGTIPGVEARARTGRTQGRAQELRPCPIAEEPPDIPRRGVSRVVAVRDDAFDDEARGRAAGEITAPQHDVPPAGFGEGCDLAEANGAAKRLGERRLRRGEDGIQHYI